MDEEQVLLTKAVFEGAHELANKHLDTAEMGESFLRDVCGWNQEDIDIALGRK